MNFQKIVKIVAGLLGVLGVVFLLRIIGTGDEEIKMAAAMGDGLSEAPPAPEGPVKVIQRSSDTIPQSKIHHGISVLSEINMENFYFFSSLSIR